MKVVMAYLDYTCRPRKKTFVISERVRTGDVVDVKFPGGGSLLIRITAVIEDVAHAQYMLYEGYREVEGRMLSEEVDEPVIKKEETE